MPTSLPAFPSANTQPSQSAAARRNVPATVAGELAGAENGTRGRDDTARLVQQALPTANDQRPDPLVAAPRRSDSARALLLAEEQNLTRNESLALSSYAATEALAAAGESDGRELLVGIDLFV